MNARPAQATLVAAEAYEPKAQKINKKTQAVTTPQNGKNGQNKLRWEAVNSVTWRLVDPDGPKIETPRCHGHWPGYFTPKALAWVFDVGIEKSDWRVRVLKRDRWRAFGCMMDVDVAKRFAEAEVVS